MDQKKEFKIGNKKIGGSNPCFIVAEIGINFDGKYEQALALINAAAQAHCDAVKFQLFKAERMYHPKAGEDKTGEGKKKDIYKIVQERELPLEWIPKLRDYAKGCGLEFVCTTCDEESTDILDNFGVDAYKFASYEITHLPLLRYTARKNKPIILSSGAATLLEIIDALEIFKEEQNQDIALLHCVGVYGAPLESLNLKVLTTFQLAFPEIVIGFSDHSADPISAPRAAVALGAKIIEKHVTLDKNLPGPDHFFALDPRELAIMVKTIRKTEEEMKQGKEIPIEPKLLGTSEKKIYSESEKMTRDFTHRCLFAKKPIKKRELFTRENIVVLRPGNEKRGLEPKYYELLIDRYRATRDIPKNQSICWDDVLSK